MKKLFDSYLDYLSANPGEFTSLLLYSFQATIITIVLIRTNRDIIHGIKGNNTFMESPEAVIYLMCWTFPYILNYAAFFQAELAQPVWWFMYGCIAWALGGRWLFEWLLALRAGSRTVTERTMKEEPASTKVTTEKTTETKTET